MNMWNLIEKITEQVTLYATLVGQMWYFSLVFFRLIVVVSIGSSVYSDEQSAFRCSTKVIGCDNVCYDRFAKISHIRFWSFQLLALTSPVAMFHFYTIFMKGRIEKLNAVKAEKEIAEKEDNNNTQPILKNPGKENWNIAFHGVQQQLRRRQKKVGKTKTRQVFDKEKLQEITMTKGIHMAYYISVLARITIEFIFLYLAYDLFRFAEYPKSYSDGRIVSNGLRVDSPIDLFWIRVPQLYRCGGETVRWACGQHMLPGNSDAYVPCWVSRPWEKTIFLQYMNTFSLIGFLLSITEFMQITVRTLLSFNKQKSKKKNSDFRYERAPSLSQNESSLEPAVKQSITEVSYNAENTAPNNPDQTNLQTTTLIKDAPKTPSDPTIDLENAKMTVNELRELLQHRDRKRLTRRRESNKPLKNSDIPKYPSAKKSEKSKILFRVPYATQSLNRPKKVVKPNFQSLYKFGSISFSHSDPEDDSGGGTDASDGSTDRVSVSVHSATSDIV